MHDFGEKLRTLRKTHKFTQQQLATRLGYASQGYINEIEAGRKTPTAEFILKVADLFDVPTDVLMRDTRALPQDADHAKGAA